MCRYPHHFVLGTGTTNEVSVGFRSNRVKRHLGIPRDVVLDAWAPADYRGMRIPGPPLAGVAYSAPYVGLADRRLWITKAGAKRQFAVEDMVMITADPRTNGVLRVDFIEGDPLVVMVVDDGGFRRRLEAALASFDRQLQMDAESALGLPDRSPELLAKAEEARRRSHELLRMAGTDRFVTMVADGFMDEERVLLHEAQLDALRKLRRALLASQLVDGSAGRGAPGGP